MSLSPVALQHFKQTADRILHVPGNFTGQVLEMALVIDKGLARAKVETYVPELLGCLKRHGDVFLNVRLNVVEWDSDEQIHAAVQPMTMMMLGSFYEGYRENTQEKHFEVLAAYLKKFQARSKLIVVVTDGGYTVEREDMLLEAMRPFLEKKLMQAVIAEDGRMDIRYRFVHTV